MTSSYGQPGTGTYSQLLSGLDALIATLPDNTINQITAKNMRDVSFTIWENMLANTLANLYQVTVNGNTTSLPITIGGLQVSGTSSFSNNLSLLNTLTDKTGATGTNGYILSATNGGIYWIPNNSSGIYITPSLAQVANVGNTTSRSIEVSGIQINGTASIAGDLRLYSTLTDKNGSSGTPGYVLSSTSSGVQWVPISGLSSVPSLDQVVAVGSTTSRTIGIYNNFGIYRSNGTQVFNFSPTGSMIIQNGFTSSFRMTIASGTSSQMNYVLFSHETVTTLKDLRLIAATLSTQRIVVIPDLSGNILLDTNSGLQSITNYGNTSSRAITIGGLINTNGATLSGTVIVNNNLLINGTASFNSQITINNGFIIYATSSFVGTASFNKGIIDNYGIYGSAGNVLSIDSSNKVKWTTTDTQINNQTSNYTLVLSDNKKLLTITSSSAVNITVPPISSVAFNTGTTIDISQMGTGFVSFVPGVGVNINSKDGCLTIAGQYVSVSLIKTGTNSWLLIGDLIP